VGTWSFQGNVIWEKQERPDPEFPVRAGAVRYRIASGQVHVSYKGTRVFTFPSTYTCSDEGGRDAALLPNDPPDDPVLQSYLDLGPDGQYTGYLHQRTQVTVARVCPDGPAGSFAADGTMSLRITGSLVDGRRMQGSMAPESDARLTLSGSWDFSPR
jgi:hypothetical protein